mmetsp:Transcript_24613/g.81849  ORF Transcript_24613/g.81849 Transcript_24613/m.81849 type:complete len:202 (+) Transcript_24613:123-728(+)
MHLPSPAAPPRPGLALRTAARAARHLYPALDTPLWRTAPHAHTHTAGPPVATAQLRGTTTEQRSRRHGGSRLRLACLLRLRRLAPLALCSLAAPQGWAYSAAASGKTEAGGGADAAASRAMVSSRALSRSRAGSSSVLPVGCGVASDGVSPASKPRMAGLSCWKSGVLMKISMAMSVPIPAHASRNTTFSTGDCSSSSGSE